MKKTMIFVVAIMVLVFVGCDVSNVTGVSDEDTGFTLDAEGLSVASGSARASSTSGIKVAFRSSDLEFWASDGDFTNLMSTKYGENYTGDFWINEGEDAPLASEAGYNVSKEVSLSNTTNNVVFMPNSVKFGDVYDMADFDTDKVYDVVRMDIGGGEIEYSKNASALKLSDGTSIDELDINSIILVDNTVLTETVYVPSSMFYDNTPTGNAFVNDFIINNIVDYDNMLPGIDMDGALFIPFNAIDFRGKGEIKKLKIRVQWDMDSIFSAYDVDTDTYTLDGSADGTPYDFDIEVEIN